MANLNDTIINGKLQLTGKIIQPIPTAVTFQNSWKNYHSDWADAAYYKDSMNFVHLEGLIDGGTLPNTAFTLPVGYRPLVKIYYPVLCNATGTNYIGKISIWSTGEVYIESICKNSWLSIDGIVFLAEQ